MQEQQKKLLDDSFRVLDSEREEPNIVLNRNEEIKIQENLFEDSSHKILQNASNDSLLNESDLNNYFQEQKFSIEDFKSLDKRKLILEDNHPVDADLEQSGPTKDAIPLPPSI